MNKSFLIFKHEFLRKIKSAGFIILTLSVPVLALLGIGLFRLAKCARFLLTTYNVSFEIACASVVFISLYY